MGTEISYFEESKTLQTLSQFAEIATEIISILQFIFHVVLIFKLIQTAFKMILKTLLLLMSHCVMRISDDQHMHLFYVQSAFCKENFYW